MFLKPVVQNATTWSRTLQELTNLIIEYEQPKENLFKTNNRLQCSLKWKIMRQIVKNRDK